MRIRKTGGYYLTAHDAEALITRPKETYDGAVPSGNAVAEEVLEELAALTGEILFREAADRQHRFMAGCVKEYPAAHCFSLMAMAKSLYPHKELVCTGSELPDELISYLRENPAHDLSILFQSAENKKKLSELAPFTASYPISKVRNGIFVKTELAMHRKQILRNWIYFREDFPLKASVLRYNR